MDAHANLAVSAVAVAPTPPTTGASLTVATGQGVRFPAAPFNATVTAAGAAPDPSNSEIIRVTGVAGDVLTFTRQAESGGTSRAILAGDRVAVTVTGNTLTDIEAAITTNTSAVAAEASTRATADTAEATARASAVAAAQSAAIGAAAGLAIALGGF